MNEELRDRVAYMIHDPKNEYWEEAKHTAKAILAIFASSLVKAQREARG